MTIMKARVENDSNENYGGKCKLRKWRYWKLEWKMQVRKMTVMKTMAENVSKGNDDNES